MKRNVIALMLLLLSSTSWAQGWKLVVTRNNGTTIEAMTSDVKDITFVKENDDTPTLPDKNADQIIIKEVYVGGCPKDEGTEFFQQDKCIILYNNCPQQAVVNNLCIAFATPYNSNSKNDNYTEGGHLVYEADDFTPAQNGIWYYPRSLVFEPYGQVVINVCGAIDNTKTYSQSVNYANADYYCMYDPESGYNQTSYYPTPADVIPTSHYWRAAKYGQARAWPLSSNSPALFIYQPKGTTPVEHATDPDQLWYPVGVGQTPVHACIRVPNDWIIDAVEVFNAAQKEDNMKRLTADLDAGYVYLTNKLGHTLYRNVEREETEALPENKGKLVYNYSLGDDPSGIDAEASIAAGAHIVYQDYNDSSSDFHERQKCSLRK